MGTKLILDPNDPFFEPVKVNVAGVAGSCYCCSQQIHVPFKHMDDLPLAKINKEHFYVFLCDQCEDDIAALNEFGVSNVSYDVLWIIQEPLEQELILLEDQRGSTSSLDREEILIRLYQETSVKLNKPASNRLLEILEEEEIDESELKRKSKKDS